jgi:rusticyanin
MSNPRAGRQRSRPGACTRNGVFGHAFAGGCGCGCGPVRGGLYREQQSSGRGDGVIAAVASPAGGPDATFRIAGMVNPTITVPAGATVSMQVINADPGTAHGMVITASSGQASWMPMMTAWPAFTGSAVRFLGSPTSSGMHTGTLTFTAAPGAYHYLCPVPGHAQKGMAGLLTVSSTG